MSFITYSQHPHKGFSIPYSSDGSARCTPITDFHVFHSDNPAGALTEIRSGYDNAFLYVEIICHETAGIQAGNHDGGTAVWDGGDMLEILLGGLAPYAWQQQYAINAGGGFFASCDATNLRYSVAVKPDRWIASLQLPLSQLPLQTLSIGFAVARYAKSRNEISIWGNMTCAFHDVEDYGEIIFNDYNSAYLSKMGHVPSPAITSREDYEHRITAESIHAESIIHGPWLSQPSSDSITISFGTAGRCGAFLEYRQANTREQEPWQRVAIDRHNAVLSFEHEFHTLRLENLKSGTLYEYRAITITPVTHQLIMSPSYSFRTFSENTQDSFSFVFFSDIHSNFSNLQNILKHPAVSSCDFLVCGGDCLSNSNGPDALYAGLLDPIAATGKPTVFIRGNHEQRGPFAETGDRMMSMSGNAKTYFTFKCASTLFIALDAGEDHPDDDIPVHANTPFLTEEKRWLQELTNTRQFTEAVHRIVLIHIPPHSLNKYEAQMANELLQILVPHKIDLVISGHLHKLAEIKADSAICQYLQTDQCVPAPKYPFPVIINSDVHALNIAITPNACKYEIVTF